MRLLCAAPTPDTAPAPRLDAVPARHCADKKPPKGFGQFYPKGKAGEKAGESAKKAGEKGSTSTGTGAGSSSSSSGSSFKAAGGAAGGGAGGGAPTPNGDMGPRIASVLAALGILGVWLSRRDSTGQEINWQEFATVLLESGEVDRIIVSNGRIAEVILRPGAVIPMQRAGEYGGETAGYGDAQPTDGNDGRQSWSSSDDTADDAGGERASPRGRRTPGADASGAAGSPFQRYPRIGSAGPSQLPSYHFAIGSVELFERKLEAAQRALGIDARDFVPVQYVQETNWMSEAMKFLPTILIIGAWLYVMRTMGGSSGGGGGGMSNIFKIGRSNAKKVNKEEIKVTYKDVAGCDEAKKEVMEFVEFLKDPSKFHKLGAKIPKGALLCGPPGTGKTLLAKATAGEASVPFFSISGSDFVEMFVGVGASRVRDLFKEARANAPCIVFIDEIDAVGRQRGKGGFAGGNDERENTLNQLLVEMDGFNESAGVVVLAGTNRVDILDKALTRPGRFDRTITMANPDIKGRKQIFEVHLKGINIDGPISDYAGRLAGLTPGFSGADIANVCNEAAIFAARRDKDKVDFRDFESAADRVIGGLESNKIMTPEEKRIVAFHEAGHAVAGWFLEHADPLLKVTIVPRGNGALGFAQYLPKEIALRSKDQILDIMCMALGGRASEQLAFNSVTTGASDDLRRVTQMVYGMIQIYGMNDRVGQLAFPPNDNGMMGEPKPYSDATAQAMDEEARKIVDEAYARTLSLLATHKDSVRAVAELLMEKETINHDDIVDILGHRPFVQNKQYAEFITARTGANDDLAKSAQEKTDAVPKPDSPAKDDDAPTDAPPLAPA